jgi:hypothetical protein
VNPGLDEGGIDMSSDDGPRLRVIPSRNEVEDRAIAAIDHQRRFQSFLCLLLWQFGRDNSDRTKLLTVLQELTRGIRIGEPESTMEGASQLALNRMRLRLLRALERAARTLANETWTPAELRADFQRFAGTINRCLQQHRSEMNSYQLLDGLASIVAEIREALN